LHWRSCSHGGRPGHGGYGGRKKWVDEEFQPSTLSKKEQLKEMEWFIKAANRLKA
jgi:glycerol transport system substrate-binding protein